MTQNKILVPVDFSEASEIAAQYAVRIADTSHSSMTFLHVQDDKKSSRFDLENKLKIFCHKATTNYSVGCENVIADGNIFKAIPAVAAEKGFLMMVIATHGVQGLRQKMMGADILKLIRTIPIPVLVVQKGSKFPGEGIRKLVFPVGGHDRFDKQIDAAIMMAGIFDMEVQIYSIHKKGDEWTPMLKKNILESEKRFAAKGIRYSRIDEEPNVLSVGYARQTLKFAKGENSDMISIMSVPTREHYYFAQADKQEVLTNDQNIPVLCTSDAEGDI